MKEFFEFFGILSIIMSVLILSAMLIFHTEASFSEKQMARLAIENCDSEEAQLVFSDMMKDGVLTSWEVMKIVKTAEDYKLQKLIKKENK